MSRDDLEYPRPNLCEILRSNETFAGIGPLSRSPHRQWQAIVGLVLAALGVVFFIIAHVIS